ncbi:MAG: hypothetical protein WDO68_04440 [Gammaproteobacteria bacterium]
MTTPFRRIGDTLAKAKGVYAASGREQSGELKKEFCIAVRNAVIARFGTCAAKFIIDAKLDLNKWPDVKKFSEAWDSSKQPDFMNETSARVLNFVHEQVDGLLMQFPESNYLGADSRAELLADVTMKLTWRPEFKNGQLTRDHAIDAAREILTTRMAEEVRDGALTQLKSAKLGENVIESLRHGFNPQANDKQISDARDRAIAEFEGRLMEMRGEPVSAVTKRASELLSNAILPQLIDDCIREPEGVKRRALEDHLPSSMRGAVLDLLLKSVQHTQSANSRAVPNRDAYRELTRHLFRVILPNTLDRLQSSVDESTIRAVVHTLTNSVFDDGPKDALRDLFTDPVAVLQSAIAIHVAREALSRIPDEYLKEAAASVAAIGIAKKTFDVDTIKQDDGTLMKRCVKLAVLVQLRLGSVDDFKPKLGPNLEALDEFSIDDLKRRGKAITEQKKWLEF